MWSDGKLIWGDGQWAMLGLVILCLIICAAKAQSMQQRAHYADRGLWKIGMSPMIAAWLLGALMLVISVISGDPRWLYASAAFATACGAGTVIEDAKGEAIERGHRWNSKMPRQRGG